MLFSKKKIEKIKSSFLLTHNKVCVLLADKKLVRDASFETAVLLFQLALIRYHEDKAFVEDLLQEISPVVDTFTKGRNISPRLKLYSRAAYDDVQPRGFWMLGDAGPNFFRSARNCVLTLYGDFLIYPDCVFDYEECAVPVFDIFDVAEFTQTFSTDVIKEIGNYLAVIGLR